MIEDGAVAVCNGRVLHVGTRSWVLRVLADELDTPRQTRLRERRWKGLITPGLVNAHTHLQYTGMAEVGKKSYDTFRAWEEAFNTVYDAPQEKPWQRWAEHGAHQLIQAGTTAAADVVSDMEAVGALKSCGLHGIAYWEVMDWENEDWSRKGAHTLLSQLAEAGKDRNIHLGISPHAPYSLATAPCGFARYRTSLGMRLHIHLGETLSTAARFFRRSI
jgi:cytosine/adenosine deaminase-related metal-dependent hydrolase